MSVWKRVLAFLLAVVLASLGLFIADRRPPPVEWMKSMRFKGPNCNEISNLLDELKHPWQVNELRRNVSLESPACFKLLFDEFAHVFERRIGLKNQYSLHIPKTAGTSLCNLVRRNPLKAPPRACRHESYCPYWCCPCDTEINGKSLSCKELNETGFNFVFNERWMDLNESSSFCDDWAYSITIREPVSRAISNMHMWHSIFEPKTNMTKEQQQERITIIQSNYMTWSLVGSVRSDYPPRYRVTDNDLDLAKQILSRFDFFLDVQTPHQCSQVILHLMGMKRAYVPHARVAGGNYSSLYDWNSFAEMNSVDAKLYEYAQQVIEADCKFFQRVVQKKT